LYECENYSLTLREEYGLGEFKNRELRRIFGPKSEEVTGTCRVFITCMLHEMLLGGRDGVEHVARMGEVRNL
jgi:hypothetical protein